jgi:hypothetical protein
VTISERKYGTLDGESWTYNFTDNGDETYHVEETISYTVNTGILSQNECQYMRELLSSPQAFVSVLMVEIFSRLR